MIDRNIYNLLGLSFDAVDMQQTVRAIRKAIEDDKQLFLSTPNLNFLIASQKNKAFQQSVLNSDLSIADGMPIVFMCKLLNIPIKERVAGSSLIDQLRNNDEGKKKPIKVFFFGGQDGIAEKAHNVLLQENAGLKSVGFLNPGFGTLDDMSSEKVINEINKAGPEFIIVSLGAQKGQAWIEENRQKLHANVISHLGAVVNFIAGNVKRAPIWVQKLHMEWLWRIKEEPQLFARYWQDGAAFLKLLISNILPYRSIIKRSRGHTSAFIDKDLTKNNMTLKGDITALKYNEIKDILSQMIQNKKDIKIDFAGVSYIDQSILGLLLSCWVDMDQINCHLNITNANSFIMRIFQLNNLNFMVQKT